MKNFEHSLTDRKYHLSRQTYIWFSSNVLPFDEQEEDELPESHTRKLLIKTKKYGNIIGFFHKGIFMKDYSSTISCEIIQWMYLPE